MSRITMLFDMFLRLEGLLYVRTTVIISVGTGFHTKLNTFN